MKKESLEKAADLIAKVLHDEPGIDQINKTELISNIVHLLINYDEDIKVLQREQAKKKYLNI